MRLIISRFYFSFSLQNWFLGKILIRRLMLIIGSRRGTWSTIVEIMIDLVFSLVSMSIETEIFTLRLKSSLELFIIRIDCSLAEIQIQLISKAFTVFYMRWNSIHYSASIIINKILTANFDSQSWFFSRFFSTKLFLESRVILWIFNLCEIIDSALNALLVCTLGITRN